MSFLCFTTNGVLVPAFLFLVLSGVSIHVFVHIRVRAYNSNRTTVRTFSNFNLLCGHCMLLPFPSALTLLCVPDYTCRSVECTISCSLYREVGTLDLLSSHCSFVYIWSNQTEWSLRDIATNQVTASEDSGNILTRGADSEVSAQKWRLCM